MKNMSDASKKLLKDYVDGGRSGLDTVQTGCERRAYWQEYTQQWLIIERGASGHFYQKWIGAAELEAARHTFDLATVGTWRPALGFAGPSDTEEAADYSDYPRCGTGGITSWTLHMFQDAIMAHTGVPFSEEVTKPNIVVPPVPDLPKKEKCDYAGKREPKADWVAVDVCDNPYEALSTDAVVYRIEENRRREEAAFMNVKRTLRAWPTCKFSGNELELVSEDLGEGMKMHGAWVCLTCD